MALHSVNMDPPDWQEPSAHQSHFSDKKPVRISPASAPPAHLDGYPPVAISYYGHPELWTVQHHLRVRFRHIHRRRDCVADANTLVVDPRRHRNRRVAGDSLGHHRVDREYRYIVERDLASASRCLVARETPSAVGNPHARWRFRANGWRFHE